MSFRGLTTFWLNLGVTLRVCTSCLWVFHVYWVHGLWMTLGCAMMEIHMGSGLLTNCLTLYQFLCSILPWRIRILDNLMTSFCMHMGIYCLLRRKNFLGGVFGIRKEALSPRWHGYTWFLATRLVFDLRMVGLCERSCRLGDPKEHAT